MSTTSQSPTRWRSRVVVLAVLAATLGSAATGATAADGPSLGAARSFAALGFATVTTTGLTAVTGDVGVSSGSAITGFPPATIARGAIHAGDATALAAQADAGLAYDFLAGMASIPANNLSGMDLGGLTLAPGVYKFDSSAQLTGDLTLDAGGRSDALFVFQIASALTTASASSVRVINGGADYDESNLFWQVGSSATLGSGTDFRGNILAYASVTLVSGTSMLGNAIALNGGVTMESNRITSPSRAKSNTFNTPEHERTRLIPPPAALDADAFAKLEVKHFPENRQRRHTTPERSTFSVKARHLNPSTMFTLWANDPSTPGAELVQFATFTTARSGNFNYSLDTKKGDAMPFGATLAQLSGAAIEVRDAAGTTTIVAGTIPTTFR